jgi:hypothetical protein
MASRHQRELAARGSCEASAYRSTDRALPALRGQTTMCLLLDFATRRLQDPLKLL